MVRGKERSAAEYCFSPNSSPRQITPGQLAPAESGTGDRKLFASALAHESRSPGNSKRAANTSKHTPQYFLDVPFLVYLGTDLLNRLQLTYTSRELEFLIHFSTVF